MARPLAEKCRRCAKLPVIEAKEKDCWAGQPCHVRRHSYRNRDRYNKQKKQRYAIATGKIIPEITVAVPESPAAILHLYRVRVDAPLHAIAAELWVRQRQVAKVEPVHCLGWTGMQVKQYLREVLKGFSGQLEEVELERFETTVELNPTQCPIRPCPLHPG